MSNTTGLRIEAYDQYENPIVVLSAYYNVHGVLIIKVVKPGS